MRVPRRVVAAFIRGCSGTISFEEFLLLYRKVVLPQNLYGPYVAVLVVWVSYLRVGAVHVQA